MKTSAITPIAGPNGRPGPQSLALMIDAEQLDALARLDRLFEQHGVEYWLFGGWAVDLHAGSVTREHDDLDIAIWQDDQGRVAALLAHDGWTHERDAGGDGYTTYERGRVRLDLAFLACDEAGLVYTPLSDGRADWPAESFENDVATLRGVRARVVTLRGLKAEKSEVRADPHTAAKDRLDRATLEGID
jgi:hypothetical protein